MNEHFHFVENCIWQHWYICLLVCKHASETAKLISTCCWLTLGDISVFLLFDFSSYFSVIFGKFVSLQLPHFVNMAVRRLISTLNLYLIRAQIYNPL